MGNWSMFQPARCEAQTGAEKRWPGSMRQRITVPSTSTTMTFTTASGKPTLNSGFLVTSEALCIQCELSARTNLKTFHFMYGPRLVNPSPRSVSLFRPLLIPSTTIRHVELPGLISTLWLKKWATDVGRQTSSASLDFPRTTCTPMAAESAYLPG